MTVSFIVSRKITATPPPCVLVCGTCFIGYPYGTSLMATCDSLSHVSVSAHMFNFFFFLDLLAFVEFAQGVGIENSSSKQIRLHFCSSLIHMRLLLLHWASTWRAQYSWLWSLSQQLSYSSGFDCQWCLCRLVLHNKYPIVSGLCMQSWGYA